MALKLKLYDTSLKFLLQSDLYLLWFYDYDEMVLFLYVLSYFTVLNLRLWLFLFAFQF